MKLFSEELKRRREERRQKKSSTWSGLLIKIIVLIVLVLLIRFLISPAGRNFGNYWKDLLKQSSSKVLSNGIDDKASKNLIDIKL